MPHQIVIAPGYSDVVLPDGGTYQAGDTVVLTNGQWAQLDPAFKSDAIVDYSLVNVAPGEVAALTSGELSAPVRTVRVVERHIHHFSAMQAVAVTEGLAQSWVLALPAEAVPLSLTVQAKGHEGVKPEVAWVELAVRKVAGGAGDLESDVPPVTISATNPVLTLNEGEPNIWALSFDSIDGEHPAIEPHLHEIILMEPGWYRSIIRIRWAV